MKHLLIFLAGLCLIGSQAKGEDAIIPEKTVKAPVIDGKIESLWGKPFIPYFVTAIPTAQAGEIPANKTKGYMLYDDAFLYLAFECEEHTMEGLVTNKMKARDGSWGDDGLEIFLDPGRTKSSYYQIMVNAAGTVSDWEWRAIDTGVPSETKNWDNNVLVKTTKGDRGWVCELSIPWADFAGNHDVTDPWGINVARWEPRKSIGQSWAPLMGGFHQPAKFQELKFRLDPKNYGYRLSDFSFGALSFGNNRLTCKVKHEGKEKADVEAKATWQISEGAWQSTNSRPTLLPGETKEVSVCYGLAEKGKPGKIIFSLLNPGTGFIHLEKVSYFTIPSSLLDLKMDKVYYLSDAKTDLKIKINLGDADREKSLLTVTLPEPGSEAFKKTISSPSLKTIVPIDIARFGVGEYNVSVELFDSRNNLLESQQVPFKRLKNPF